MKFQVTATVHPNTRRVENAKKIKMLLAQLQKVIDDYEEGTAK